MKNIFQKKTTEDLFGIISQPPDTCPMIDKLIDDLEIHKAYLLDFFSTLQNVFILDCQECLECKNNDLIEEFNDIIEGNLSVLDNKIDKIEQLVKDLNIFRKWCEELRRNGHQNKALLWQQIELSVLVKNDKVLLLNKKHEYRPSEIFPQEFDLSFSSLNQEKLILKFKKSDSCEECLLSEDIDARSNQIKSFGFEDKIFNDALFNRIKENYEKLFLWNKQIKEISIKTFFDLIND